MSFSVLSASVLLLTLMPLVHLTINLENMLVVVCLFFCLCESERHRQPYLHKKKKIRPDHKSLIRNTHQSVDLWSNQPETRAWIWICYITFQTFPCCSLSTPQLIELPYTVGFTFNFHLTTLTSGEQIPACLIPSARNKPAPLFCHSSLLRQIYLASKGTVGLWSDDTNLILENKDFFLSDF